MPAIYRFLLTFLILSLTVIVCRADGFKYAGEAKSQELQADYHALNAVRQFESNRPGQKMSLEAKRAMFEEERARFVSDWKPMTAPQLFNSTNNYAHAENHCRRLAPLVFSATKQWVDQKKGINAPQGSAFAIKNNYEFYIHKVHYDPSLDGHAKAMFQVLPDPKSGELVRTLRIGAGTFRQTGRAGQFLHIAHEIYHALEFQQRVIDTRQFLERLNKNASREELDRKAEQIAYKAWKFASPRDRYAEEVRAEKWARAFADAMIPGGLPPGLREYSLDYERGKRADRNKLSVASTETQSLLDRFRYLTRHLRQRIWGTTGVSNDTHPQRKLAETLFRKSIEGEPVFGGIVLGNRTSREDIRPTGVAFRVAGDAVILVLQLECNGQPIECEYRPSSPTELWAAYHIVQPLEEWQIAYGLDGTESSLVSMEQNIGNGAVNFALHPALITNETGRSLALADAMFALSPPGLFEKVNVNLSSAQWHDEQPSFLVVDSKLIVQAATGPPEVLVRASFWGLTDYDEQDMRVVTAQTSSLVEGHIPNIQEQYIQAIMKSLDESDVGSELTRTPAEFLEEMFKGVHDQNKRQSYSDTPRLVTAFHHYRCLNDLNAFAKTLAVLNWIRDNSVELPRWPSGVEPQPAHTPSEILIAELEESALQISELIAANLGSRSIPEPWDPWWRAPADDYHGIPISQEKYSGVAPLPMSQQFSERKVMFADVPAIEATKTLQCNLDPLGVRVQEVFKIVSTDDDQRRPLIVKFERHVDGAFVSPQVDIEQPMIMLDRSLIEKLSPQMKHLEWEIALHAGQWRQVITINGEPTLDEPCPAPDSAVFQINSLSQSIRGFLQQVDLGSPQGDKPIWRVKHTVNDPFPVTETYSFRPSNAELDADGNHVSNIQIKPVKTLSPLVKYGSILRDFTHREMVVVDSTGLVSAWQIQLPPAFGQVQQNEQQNLLDHPHMKFMIEAGRLFPRVEHSNHNEVQTAGHYVVLLPPSEQLDQHLMATRTKYFIDLPAPKTDQPIDSRQALKSLRLRLRFAHPPVGDWAHWDSLQQEVVESDNIREITIFSPTHHRSRLAKPDSDWELDFCSQPTSHIESNDPGIMGLARAVQADEITPLVDKLKRIANSSLQASYRYVGKPLTAAQALQLKEGACLETSFLLAAMARSRGIPARIVFGLIYDEETSQFIPHAWNEVYLETAEWSGWYPCDPSFENDVDARYLKLFHAADVDLPIDMARTPRGVFNACGVELIEVMETVYQETSPQASVRHIRYVSKRRTKDIGFDLSPALQRWNAFRLGQALILILLDDSTDLSTTEHIYLPDFANDFDLLLPMRVERKGMDTQGIRHAWLIQDALPAISWQLRASYGQDVAAAFRFPWLMMATETLDPNRSNPNYTADFCAKLVESLQQLGLPEPLIQEYQQRMDAWRNQSSDSELFSDINSGVLEYLSSNSAAIQEHQSQELASRLQVTPNDSNLRFRCAQQLVDAGMYVEALEMLEPIRPSDPAFAESRFVFGLCALHKKRWSQAIQAFTLASEDQAQQVDSMVHLAWIDYETGRESASRTKLKRILELEPAHPQAWYLLAMFSAWEGELEQAIQHVQQSLECAPWNSEALILLVRLLAADGNSNLDQHSGLILRLASTRLGHQDVSKQHESVALLNAIAGEFDSALEFQDMAIQAASLLQHHRLKQQRQDYQRRIISYP